MRFKKLFMALMLFLLPTNVCRILFLLLRMSSVRIGKHSHIGFSYINCSQLEIEDGSSIGHLNYISCKELRIRGGKIKHLNIIKGNLSLILEKGAWINSQNKIAANWHDSDRPRVMHMQESSVIIMKHTFDLTDNIVIGEGSLFAGTGTQVWTHAFYLGNNRDACVIGPVVIGKKCYVGSGVIICAGVKICDNVSIGAGVTVAKNLSVPGLYVNQPLRFLDFNADEAISNLGEPTQRGFWRKKT